MDEVETAGIPQPKAIIEKIEGSYSNVVGLPMEKTVRILRDFGVTP